MSALARVCGWFTTATATPPDLGLERMLELSGGGAGTRSLSGAGWALGAGGVSPPEGVLHSTARVTAGLVGRIAFADPSLETVRRKSGAAAALAAAYEASVSAASWASAARLRRR